MSNEEKIQILYTGDFADGTGAKLEEINKALCEKMGLSVEFLTGDAHVSSYVDQMRKAQEEAEDRRAAFQRSLREPLNKLISTFMLKVKRANNGLGDKRVKNIRAMRAGKDTCFRGSPETRACRREAAADMAWVPVSMRNTWSLW